MSHNLDLILKLRPYFTGKTLDLIFIPVYFTTWRDCRWKMGLGFQTNHGLFIFSVISAYRLNCYPLVYLSLLIHYHMLLLSCFSRVRLCSTPKTAAHQAPLSMGFSRQKYWSGLPLPSPKYCCTIPIFVLPLKSSLTEMTLQGRGQQTGPKSLCCSYSTLLLQYESGHRQYTEMGVAACQ